MSQSGTQQAHPQSPYQQQQGGGQQQQQGYEQGYQLYPQGYGQQQQQQQGFEGQQGVGITVNRRWNLLRINSIDSVEVANQTDYQGPETNFLKPGMLGNVDLKVTVSLPFNVPPNNMAVRCEPGPCITSRILNVELGIITDGDQPAPQQLPVGSFNKYSFIMPLVRDACPSYLDKFNLLGGLQYIHYSVKIPGQYATQDRMNCNYFIRVVVNHKAKTVEIQSIGQSSYMDYPRLTGAFKNLKLWGKEKGKYFKQRYNERKQAKQTKALSEPRGETTGTTSSNVNQTGTDVPRPTA